MNIVGFIGGLFVAIFVIIGVGILVYLAVIYFRLLKTKLGLPGLSLKKADKNETQSSGPYCQHCGKKVTKENTFCPSCGGKLK